MKKICALALCGISLTMAASALANTSTGCLAKTFFGTYTSVEQYENVDVRGDGAVFEDRTFIYQLTFYRDGIVEQNWTGSPDYILSLGTNTPWIGSWTCRSDGKLLVTTLRGIYAPAPGVQGVPADLAIVGHRRNTILFSVIDRNTLDRIQYRTRDYNNSENPTDPTAGTLFALDTSVVEYKRLKASIADLQAP